MKLAWINRASAFSAFASLRCTCLMSLLIFRSDFVGFSPGTQYLIFSPTAPAVYVRITQYPFAMKKPPSIFSEWGEWS